MKGEFEMEEIAADCVRARRILNRCSRFLKPESIDFALAHRDGCADCQAWEAEQNRLDDMFGDDPAWPNLGSYCIS